MNPTANLRLEATSIPGVNYIWRNPNNEIIGTTNTVNTFISQPLQGYYRLEVNKDNCLLLRDSVFIEINRFVPGQDVKIFSNSPVCEGGIIQLTTTAFPNAIYQWTGPSAFASSQKDASIPNSITALHQGNYTLTLTIPGCQQVQVQAFVQVLPRIQSLPSINAPDVVCAGNTFILSAAISQDLDFYWEGPDGFRSVLATNTINALSSSQSGNYYLYARQRGAYCPTLVASKLITVNEPFLGSLNLQSNAPICEGSTLRITAIPRTFTGATYTLSFKGTNQSSNLGEWVLQNALPSQTGFYTVSLDVPACPSIKDSIFIEVYKGINRSGVIVNSPVCLGNRLNFTAPITQGATYRWQNIYTGQIYTDPVFSKIAEASDNAVFSLTITYRGCNPLEQQIAVTVNPPVQQPVDVIGEDSVCVGNELRLEVANPEPGVTYRWLGPNWQSDGISLVRTRSTTSMSGTYVLRAFRDGCPEVIQKFNIYVKPRIQAKIRSRDSYCSGSTIVLEADSIPGAVYKWTLPDDSEQEGRIVTVADVDSTKAGTYRLSIEDNICGNQFLEKTIDVNTYPDSVKLMIRDTVVCAGKPIIFDVTDIPRATYTWFGPLNFQRVGRNFVRYSPTTADAGRYTVQINLDGCAPIYLSQEIVIFDDLPQITISNNSPVCLGGELKLRANVVPGATYEWQGPGEVRRNGPILNIADVPWDSAGVYTLVVKRGNCPSRKLTTQVVINNPDQVVTATVSSNPLCEGQDFQLRALGGSDSIKFDWRWQPGFRSPDRIVYLTARKDNTGPVILKYTVPGCAPKETTFVLTVNERPNVPVIYSNSPVCAGKKLELTTDWQQNAEYFWSGPNGFSSTLLAPSIQPVTTLASGIYTLQVTRPGCSPVTATTTVLVQGGESIQPLSNSPLCVGQTLRFSAQTISNATYEWRGPNNFRSFNIEPTISNVGTFNAGVYTLTVSRPGCGTEEYTIPVVVNEPPQGAIASSNSPVCVGNPISFSVTQFRNATYEWRDSKNNIFSTERLPIIQSASTADAGIYFVRISVPGCSAYTYSTRVIVNANPGNVNLNTNSPVCEGNTLEIEAPQISGAQYRWSGPFGIQGADYRLVIRNSTVWNTGLYVLELTVPGCTTITQSIEVKVNQNIAANINVKSNSPICTGETLQLSADFVQGATYLWYTRRGQQSGSNSISVPSVTLADAGQYEVQVSVPGCAPITTSTVVIIQSMPSIQIFANSPACEGSRITLSANDINDATYAWEGPNGFRATQRIVQLSVSRASEGVYTLTVNLPGCSPSQQTINLEVGVSLGNISASNNSPICQGQTLNLNADIKSGVTYQWKGPGGFSATGAAVQRTNATTAHSGIYTLEVSSPGCSTRSLTTEVIINSQVLPQIVASNNNQPLCAGQRLELTTRPLLQSNKYTWQWFGPGGITGRQPSFVIEPVSVGQSGIYSLVVTQPGCGTETLTINITVNQNVGNVQPTSNSPVCAGGELQLNSLFFSTAQYKWSGPQGFSATIHNPKRSITSTTHGGIYTLEVTVPGCGTTPYTINVTVNEAIPNITINPTEKELCAGENLRAVPTFVQGADYRWSGPNRFIATTRELSITSITTPQTGVYTLTVSRTGCQSQTATISIQVKPSPVVSAIPNVSTICQGSDITLTGISVPPAQYLWSGPNNFTSTEAIVTLREVTIERQGEYTFEATLAGCSSRAKITLNIVPRIPDYTFSSNSPVCVGADLNLTAPSPTPGATFAWSGPAGYTSTLQNPTRLSIQTNHAGVYSLVVRQGNCTIATATQTISVLPLPAVPRVSNNGPACPGGELQLSANFIPNAIYIWRGPNNYYSEEVAPVIRNMNLSKIGEYSLQVIVSGCTSSVATTRVTQNPAIDSVVITGPTIVCTGNRINLIASAVTGGIYNWIAPSGKTYSSNNLQISSAQFSDRGTYSLNVIVGRCTLQATHRVEVLPTANAELLGASQVNICKGASAELTIQVSGIGPW
ncbi:MAG: hypothetical protein RML72_06440, partial [Bacteroidia bacterium]|nr:hypothetical protein [Bacteroidia bacterium]